MNGPGQTRLQCSLASSKLRGAEDTRLYGEESREVELCASLTSLHEIRLALSEALARVNMTVNCVRGSFGHISMKDKRKEGLP